MRLTVEKAYEIAEKYVGCRLLNCVRIEKELVFRYDSKEFDPFVAVNIRTGRVRYFTPTECLCKYSKCYKKKIF